MDRLLSGVEVSPAAQQGIIMVVGENSQQRRLFHLLLEKTHNNGVRDISAAWTGC